MFYVKNLPNWERALRILAGLAVSLGAFVWLGGTTAVLVALGAVGLVASGLIGFFPLCALAGRRLAKRARERGQPPLADR